MFEEVDLIIHQREHRPAHLPAQRLAVQETSYRLPATDPGAAIGGYSAGRALGHRFVPSQGRS